jgi:very-long-chain enoyl-CoA reductase
MFETIAWIGIWLVTWSWSTLIFNVLAVGQMMAWAKKKEDKYRKNLVISIRKEVQHVARDLVRSA